MVRIALLTDTGTVFMEVLEACPNDDFESDERWDDTEAAAELRTDAAEEWEWEWGDEDDDGGGGGRGLVVPSALILFSSATCPCFLAVVALWWFLDDDWWRDGREEAEEAFDRPEAVLLTVGWS